MPPPSKQSAFLMYVLFYILENIAINLRMTDRKDPVGCSIPRLICLRAPEAMENSTFMQLRRGGIRFS